MAEFTKLDRADVERLATTFSLGEVARVRAIAAGTINSNFELETSRGRFFLRVNEGKSEADVRYEAALVAALAAGGVPTPAPLVARDGRAYAPLGAKFASAFPWRDGRHLREAEVTPISAGALGAALARLHLAGRELPQRESIYDHAHLERRYAGFAASPDPALAPAIAIVGEELAIARGAAAVRAAATRGVIHGDLFRDNVLWAGDELAAILDFEQASGGSFAYDLAVCVNDWCWDPVAAVPRFDCAAALFDKYIDVRPLAEADRAALPIEVRAAATRFTITRITDVYLAKVANPEKDFRAFLARVEAWRGPALGRLVSLL